MSGHIQGSGDHSSAGPHSVPLALARNGRLSPTSPLKVFGQAKKKINDIFVELSHYIDEGVEFLNEIASETDLVTPEQVKQFAKYKEKVRGIMEILKRDRMKVAFFGRTSNGKSSVINAMLGNKILPSGMGHTTNCFLQVEGASENEAYFINEQEPDKKNSGLKNISSIANAQCKGSLSNDTLIRICWPKEQCPLLREDVVLVDSPGIDVSPDLDGWIEKFCLDADVFVLVANAESTLMQTEKNFFHRVSERLSKPNIFILNNRWDASANELETMAEVKQQHLERSIQFLVDELKVATKQEAENRVFFVSAKEVLYDRVKNGKGTPTPTIELREGFHNRLFDFCNFERKFEECISQSAVETKFALHAQNGKEITKFMYKAMDGICIGAVNRRQELMEKLAECKSRIDSTHRQMRELTEDIREKIKRMTEEVEVKVGSALSEEIRRLSVLVDTFEVPFTADSVLIHDYKKRLHTHVEAGLSTNLQNRCSEALMSAVEEVTKEMAEQLLVLIPDESRRKNIDEFPRTNFEMAYRLDCRNLCADFQEDIEFQFSFGFTTMLRKFAGLTKAKKTIPRSLSFASTEDLTNAIINRGQNDDDMILALLNTFNSLYSRTTIGVLVVAGLLAKSVGWRLLGLIGTGYASLYLYERLTWTTGAKERAFKRQFVDYASSKLRLIVDLTSANCSHQVQQELNSTFNRLCQQVDLTRSDLEQDVVRLESEVQSLDQASKKAVSLKNKAQFTETEINNFKRNFLQLAKMAIDITK